MFEHAWKCDPEDAFVGTLFQAFLVLPSGDRIPVGVPHNTILGCEFELAGHEAARERWITAGKPFDPVYPMIHKIHSHWEGSKKIVDFA